MGVETAQGQAVKHATSEDCPCCQRCLAPGLDTDRALVGAFLAGVFARDAKVSIAEALCRHHAVIATDCAGFVAANLGPQPS